MLGSKRRNHQQSRVISFHMAMLRPVVAVCLLAQLADAQTAGVTTKATVEHSLFCLMAVSVAVLAISIILALFQGVTRLLAGGKILALPRAARAVGAHAVVCERSIIACNTGAIHLCSGPDWEEGRFGSGDPGRFRVSATVQAARTVKRAEGFLHTSLCSKR